MVYPWSKKPKDEETSKDEKTLDKEKTSEDEKTLDKEETSEEEKTLDKEETSEEEKTLDKEETSEDGQRLDDVEESNDEEVSEDEETPSDIETSEDPNNLILNILKLEDYKMNSGELFQAFREAGGEMQDFKNELERLLETGKIKSDSDGNIIPTYRRSSRAWGPSYAGIFHYKPQTYTNKLYASQWTVYVD